ncbi:DUF1206 domain-containing protein [Kushneria phyllosphaerae]|uniref:DUF1206 domain-containing protein n=1 Tax=Kushneria phyllosphaerae TaxID=2100822 RepID=A0A2R8CJP2_9GAMM|nr:DUF1206 domain-containing protein [Kushneria phyllosphaerae]SPJ33083.1 hypothetical protein KSP9073_01086 [Kushneria phyllosphaerae]
MDHPSGNTQRLVTIAARCGYTAKGMIYITIGWLSMMAVLGMGGSNGGSTEAINKLATQPFGSVLIALLAVGLFGYTAWRLVQAFFDAENKGRDWKGILTRLGYVLSGLIYAGVAINCVELLLDSGGGSSSTSSQTRTVMAHPGGIVAIFLVGLGFLGVGLRQIWRGWHHSYEKNWHLNEMTRTQRLVAANVSRVGLTARGIVFMIVALFLCLSAINTDPDDARGLGGALSAVAEQPFGPWLLSLVALGLMAYGGYCLVNARFRDVDA